MMIPSIAGRLGYFFCQVFPSESIILSGVPDVPLLEDMADRGKVTDLQNDVVAEFGERLGCGMGMGHDFFVFLRGRIGRNLIRKGAD